MDLLDNLMIHALSRTLAHSLWQGLLLALLTGAIIQFTRKRSAAFRYNSLSLLLFGFLVTISTTFYYELTNQRAVAAETERSGLSVTSATENYTPGKIAPLAAGNHSVLTVIQQKTNLILHDYAGFIVGFWFLVFCCKCLNTINGLRHIYRIRNYQVSEPDNYWIEKVRSMEQMLKISLKVVVLESRLIDIPAVTGLLKPVILLPVGMLNNLPAEQVEAILLHELAHIRRADYLVNLLQRFVETLFFFNPGVLWLSSLIKDERENCCDDIAVNVTGNKRHFVEALVSFQEYRNSAAIYFLGLNGGKSNLLNRSKRLLYSNNRMLNTIEKSALSVCIVLLAVISFAFHGSGEKPAAELPALASKPFDKSPEDVFASRVLYADRNYEPDEIPEGTSIRFTDKVNGHSQPTWLFKSNDTLYQISGDIRLLRINGELVPQENYKPYLPKIRKLMAACREQEPVLTGFLDEKRKQLPACKPTAEEPEKGKTTTTTTRTVTTVTNENGVITTSTYRDSSTVISCVPLRTDSIIEPLLTACAPNPKSFIMSYPQTAYEATTCRK